MPIKYLDYKFVSSFQVHMEEEDSPKKDQSMPDIEDDHVYDQWTDD